MADTTQDREVRDSTRETYIRDNDSGSGAMMIAIVLLVLVALGLGWFFFYGPRGGAAPIDTTPGATIDIDLPAGTGGTGGTGGDGSTGGGAQ